jgi:hypothetical protein
MPSERARQRPDGTVNKEDWTAIGVTLQTKERLATLKQGFEHMLNQGSKTWDYFFRALLDLGPLTWKFLVDESVKGIEASTRACPLPSPASTSPAKSGTHSPRPSTLDS